MPLKSHWDQLVLEPGPPRSGARNSKAHAFAMINHEKKPLNYALEATEYAACLENFIWIITLLLNNLLDSQKPPVLVQFFLKPMGISRSL